jgi:serine/threonine protein kinase
MKPTDTKIIHKGNSVITTEILPDYPQPVVVKKPSKQGSSAWNFRSLEREYEMTRSLDSVEGVRKALGTQQIGDQQALILEYIDGKTLQDHISRDKLDIRSKLDIAIDLARILGNNHQQNIIHLDINSKNTRCKCILTPWYRDRRKQTLCVEL